MSGYGTSHALRIAAIWLALTVGRAERPPIHHYTTADGLPNNAIHRILRDSKGFLWFCTGEGLSRFDNYRFKSYGVEEGLPDRDVRDIVETRDGAFMIGTMRGLCRFRPARQEFAKPFSNRFEVFSDTTWANITVLSGGPNGTVFAGTQRGLYMTREGLAFTRVAALPATEITALARDSLGELLIGTARGLYVLQVDGEVRQCGERDGISPSETVLSLIGAPDGRIWVGTTRGLSVIMRGIAGTWGHSFAHNYTSQDGLPDISIKSLLMRSDGSLWTGSYSGLAEMPNASVNLDKPFHAYTVSNGLIHGDILTMTEDSNGNLWAGSNGGGAYRIAREGFSTFTRLDGFAEEHVIQLLQDRTDTLTAVTWSPGNLFLNQLRGERIQAVRLNVPSACYPVGWSGWYQTVVNDRFGEWWVASNCGLLRYPAVRQIAMLKRMRPRTYGLRDGLDDDHINRVFEDSAGDIWISTESEKGHSIARWDRRRAKFIIYGHGDGLSEQGPPEVNSFFEDRSGVLWIGLHHLGIARWTGTRFTILTDREGMPTGGIRRIFQDQHGRLWLASDSGGVGRIDDLYSARPTVIHYTRGQGLSSNEIQDISGDSRGHIYIATGAGVDQLDPATGHVQHFTTFDGLAPGEVQCALRDQDGAMWFGTLHGLSKLKPTKGALPCNPPVLITGIDIAGVPYGLNDAGVAQERLPELPYDQNHLQFHFAGLSFAPGETLRYQYKLDGVDQAWSAATEQRSVIYSALIPGTYSFLVRAVSSDGSISPAAAHVDFSIAVPVWRRWWFLLGTFVITTTAIYGLHRLRLRSVIEIERVRMRIACDLHDDIGSTLSQIAILSEVANKKTQEELPRRALSEIAASVRDVVDALGDIVWAIDPHGERMENLASRMRSFAGELFGAREIAFDFAYLGNGARDSIPTETRRQLYLIFKELSNNVARHSRCTRVSAVLEATAREIVLRVSDNGCGVDQQHTSAGYGIKSISDRARAMGGTATWLNRDGTRVTICLPMRTKGGYTHV